MNVSSSPSPLPLTVLLLLLLMVERMEVFVVSIVGEFVEDIVAVNIGCKVGKFVGNET